MVWNIYQDWFIKLIIYMEYNPKLTISKVPLFELEVNYDSLKQFLEKT
jgi:hypothetical protein